MKTGLREFIARMVDWTRRDRLDHELREELLFHQQQLDRDASTYSNDADQISHPMRRRVGNVTAVREAARDRWSIPWADTLQQDVRYAVRGIRRNPGFAIVVVLTLALGLGANAAVFSLLSRVFAESPVGISNPESLRRVYSTTKAAGEVWDGFNHPEWLDIQTVLDGRQATAYDDDSVRVGNESGGETVGATYVDAAYWSVLGVTPALGRIFLKDEARIEVPTYVAIISHRMWQRRYGGRADVVGQSIDVSGKTYSIVGIAPRGFSGTELSVSDVWMPIGAMPMDEGDPGRYWYHVRGLSKLHILLRVDPAISPAPFNTQLTTAYNSSSFPKAPGLDGDVLLRIGALNRIREPVRARQEVNISTRLAVVSLLVLLIACANVANLLLTRLLDRRRELAVRLALGISRLRLARQMIVELLVLTLASAAAALVVGNVAGGLLRRFLMPATYWPDAVIDTQLVAGVLATAIVSAFVLSLVPVVHVQKFAGTDALKNGARGIANSGGKLRQTLVFGQTAMAAILLVGAGLCLRSLQQVAAVRVGYDVDHVAFAEPVLLGERGGESGTRSAELDDALHREAARLRLLPGVEDVAVASHPPIGGLYMIQMRFMAGDSVPKLKGRPPGIREVSSEYWRVVGANAVSGRLFNERDVSGAELVAVVNETMARTIWRGANPIGRCIMLYGGKPPCRTVIGVVQDTHLSSVIETPYAQMYIPLSQATTTGATSRASTIIVRAAPSQLSRVMADMSRSLAAALPNSEVKAQTLEGKLSPQYQPWRLSAALFSVLGALGLFVASIGLYGVVAYGVRRRLHELGIRAALGADRNRLVVMVLGQGVGTVLAGSLAGVFAAAGMSKFVTTLLYETSPRDPLVFAGVVAIMILTAALASFVPAWQAGRVSPMTALRSD